MIRVKAQHSLKEGGQFFRRLYFLFIFRTFDELHYEVWIPRLGIFEGVLVEWECPEAQMEEDHAEVENLDLDAVDLLL